MKNILGGVAIAALIAGALPAVAQTSSPSQLSPPPSVQKSAPARSDMSGSSVPRRHSRERAAAPNDQGPTPNDNIADQLNREELQQLGTTGDGSASGSSRTR